jgi:hypothetical protein
MRFELNPKIQQICSKEKRDPHPVQKTIATPRETLDHCCAGAFYISETRLSKSQA